MDALEKLKAACSMSAVKKEIPLPDGTTFDFYVTPMTLAERSKAQVNARSEDPTEFALRLLISKAKDENNELLFNVGHLPGLKNALPAALVEKIMLSLMGEELEEVQEDLKLKSTKSKTKKR